MKKTVPNYSSFLDFYENDFELLRRSRQAYFHVLPIILLFYACVVVQLAGKICHLLPITAHVWQRGILELAIIAIALVLVWIFSCKCERLWQAVCLYAQSEAWMRYGIQPHTTLLSRRKWTIWQCDITGGLACAVYWVTKLFPPPNLLWRIPQFIAVAYLLIYLIALLALVFSWISLVRKLRQRVPIILVIDDQPK